MGATASYRNDTWRWLSTCGLGPQKILSEHSCHPWMPERHRVHRALVPGGAHHNCPLPIPTYISGPTLGIRHITAHQPRSGPDRSRRCTMSRQARTVARGGMMIATATSNGRLAINDSPLPAPVSFFGASPACTSSRVFPSHERVVCRGHPVPFLTTKKLHVP